MTHLSEGSRRLRITEVRPQSFKDLMGSVTGFGDVYLVRLPFPPEDRLTSPLQNLAETTSAIASAINTGATLIVLGDVEDLVHVHEAASKHLRYHLWIAIKRKSLRNSLPDNSLPRQHVGALVYSKYDKQLQHAKTRLEYTYCPACDKTTKDYGGKKHTYHPYGTLISDVWRDLTVDPEGDITPLAERFADLFGIENYTEIRVSDLSALLRERSSLTPVRYASFAYASRPESTVLNGDVLEKLRTIPDNSIDFVFADPPYNLKKEYYGYRDDLSIAEYFLWCDAWIDEVARILRPGGTFALLNIPLWAIRHFLHLETVLNYQNWIVWDALSFPVRMIMPAHYTILCFSKGTPRPLPGLKAQRESLGKRHGSSTYEVLSPLGEGYCLRASCISRRNRLGINDRGLLSDIWWDIHRLKHNSRRVDHPCQLPPQLMYRLIALFTEPGEMVLDCFNGAGTTTLSAHQLGRRYIGIELQEKYHSMAVARHQEISYGMDPFRKEERVLTAKNSPVARIKKQKYEVPKKTLQLEVRRVAQLLGHIPSRDEMIEHGTYPIRYYDEYFVSWGEVCAGARTSGMKETRDGQVQPEVTYSQKRLF